MNLHYCDTVNDLSPQDAVAALDSIDQIELAASKGFWEREDESEWQECCDTFGDYFDAKVKEYTAFFGAPSYRGSDGEPTFPEEYSERFSTSGEDIAIWDHQGARYFLAFGQEDRELPFLLYFRKM